MEDVTINLTSLENSKFVRNGRSFSLDYTPIELENTGRLRKFTPLMNLVSGLLKPKPYSELPLPSQLQKKDEIFEAPQNALTKYRKSVPTIKLNLNIQSSRVEFVEAEKIPRPIPLTKFARKQSSLWSMKKSDYVHIPSNDLGPMIMINIPFFDSDSDYSVKSSSSLLSLRECPSMKMVKEYQIIRTNSKNN